MTYLVALEVIEKSARLLHEQDGNMSNAEHAVHCSALALALKAVRAKNPTLNQLIDEV